MNNKITSLKRTLVLIIFRIKHSSVGVVLTGHKVSASHSLETLYTRLSTQTRTLSRHLTVSLLAVAFLGGNSLFASDTTNTKISDVFPPNPAVVADIVTKVGPYTLVSENADQVAENFVGNQQQNYFSQFEALAYDEKNNPLAGAAVKYSVQKGDTYSEIAKKFNVDIGSILAANGYTVDKAKSNPDLLTVKAGDELNIPVVPIENASEWASLLQEKQKAEAQTKELVKNKASLKVNSVSKKAGKNGSARVGVATSVKRDFTARFGFYGGQCTAGVAKLRGDIAAKIRANGGGNGGQWLAVAQSAGMATGSTPAPGAVIVTRESPVGHVAYVEAVDGNMVSLVDMNYGSGKQGIYTRRTVDYHSISTKGFIY